VTALTAMVADSWPILLRKVAMGTATSSAARSDRSKAMCWSRERVSGWRAASRPGWSPPGRVEATTSDTSLAVRESGEERVGGGGLPSPSSTPNSTLLASSPRYLPEKYFSKVKLPVEEKQKQE